MADILSSVKSSLDSTSTSANSLQKNIKATNSEFNKFLKSTPPLFLDLKQDIDGTISAVKSIRTNIQGVDKAFSSLGITSKSAVGTIAKIGVTGFTVATSFLAIAGGVAKIQAGYELFNSLNTVLKRTKEVSTGLTFAEAISGSKELADSIEYINQATKGLSKLTTLSKSLFDPDAFNQYSGQAVNAFSKVEEAAYRLSTVTVSGTQRSIDALKSNIDLMRKLQQETKFAVDSVSLLNTQYDIASAGFTSNKDLLNVGKSSVSLAQAGFGDIAGSTNAIVRVLSALNEGSSEAEKRSAQIFETTKVGLLTLDQLTGVIGSLSVQSKSLGVDFAEISAALAGLTTKGVSAAEASTKLEAFFAEVAAGSQEANGLLANFRDNAGKPIQINASALKEKGIKGIVDDLRIATGGNVSVIQKLFSSKEAQEAVQLLISLGDNFETFTDRIKNVSGENLNAEAENRAKTLSGAYQKAFNESQKAIEDFGSGVAPAALEKLGAVGEVTSKLAESGASGFGKLAGTLAATSEKARIFGGFLGTAFSIIAPFALFKFVFSKLSEVGKKFNELGGENKSFWEKVQTIANKVLDKVENRIAKLLDRINKKLSELNNKAEGKTVETSSASNDSPLASLIKNSEETANKKLSEPKKREFISKESIKENFTRIENAASKTGSFLKGTFGAAKGVFKELGSYALGLGITGAAASAGLAIFSGWVDTIGKTIDKKTIPELQEMKEVLSSLSNVEGLKDLVSNLDPVTNSIQGTNVWANTLNESLYRLGRAWNIVTGSAYQYKIISEELNKATKILDSEISADLENAQKGIIAAKTADGKIAENKINRGIELNSNDTLALEAEQKEKIAKIDARIALERQKIQAAEAKGDLSLDELESLKEELKILEDKKQKQKDIINNQLKQVALQQAVLKFRNINLVVPLQIQLDNEKKRGLENQVLSIADTFKAGFDGVLKDASSFENVKSQVGDLFTNLSVYAELDPEAAIEIRKKLEQSLTASSGDKNALSKLLTLDPTALENSRKFNQIATDNVIKNAQNNINSITSVLDGLDSLGSNSSSLTLVKNKAIIDSLNKQASVLNEELSKPETTLARQYEILSQIEQLEAKRLSLQVDTQIKLELSSRKQILGLEEQLFNLEQSKLNLFSQETKYDSFIIQQARLKLRAAEQELAVKKESLAVTNKEEEIKKQAIVNALKEKAAREQSNSGRLSGLKPGEKLNLNEAKLSIEKSGREALQKVTEEQQNKIKSSLESKDIKIKGIKDSVSVFDNKDQRRLITQAVKETALQSREGISKLKEILGEDYIKLFSSGETRFAQVNTNKLEAALFKDNRLKNFDAVSKLVNQGDVRGFFGTTNNNIQQAQLLFTDRNLESRRQIAEANKTSKLDQKSALDSIEQARQKQEQNTKSQLNSLSNSRQVKSSIESALGFALGKTTNQNSVTAKPKLSTVTQDLIDTKVINSIKQLAVEFEGNIKLSIAKIEDEYSIREKIIKQSETYAESINRIVSNSDIFGDSLASTALQLATFQGNEARVNKDAEIEKAKINATVEQYNKLVDDLDSKILEARSKGASSGVINALEKRRNVAREDAGRIQQGASLDIKSINLNQPLQILAVRLQESALKIKQEYQQRELNFKSQQEIAEATSNFASNLSSAVNTIAPNSSAGATLTAQAVEIKTNADAQVRNIGFDKELTTLANRIKAVDTVIAQAQKGGADSKTLSGLNKAKDAAVNEANVRKQTIDQVKAISDANDRLTIFASKITEANAKIAEVTERLTKQAGIIRDSIDFEQRRKDLAADTNRSGTGLQTSFLNFFSKNNPISKLLNQRLEVRQNQDEGINQKARNVTDAKKEVIDLTLQKTQVDLEQKTYENALNQTALLADLLNVQQGNKPQFTTQDLIKDSIGKLTQSINFSRDIASQRSQLIDKQLGFVSESLTTKNANVDRDTLAKNLGTLGGNLLPGNFDLIRKSIESTQTALKDVKRQNIDVGSLNDPGFKKELQKLTNISKDIASPDIRSVSRNQSSGNRSTTINAPIKIDLKVTADETKLGGNFESELRTYVGKQINTSVENMSKELLKYAQSF